MSEQEYVVLFADIAGSMQLYESIGDRSAKSLIIGLQQQLSTLIDRNCGEVQEVTGDEIMARFKLPDHGLRCAQDIHQCAESFSKEKSVSVLMRIGLHIGTAIVEQNRMFGDTVNLASRVAAIAQGGQTITTEALIKRAAPRWMAHARQFDITKIKGKSEPVVVYDLPSRSHDITAIKPVVASPEKRGLRLTYHKQIIELDEHDGEFSIGRALTNNLVVNAEPVSRRHTTIELIRDRYVVTDKSTNGTHVYLENGETIYLRREQLPFWGQGHLALGAPSNLSVNHVVHFSCNAVAQDPEY